MIFTKSLDYDCVRTDSNVFGFTVMWSIQPVIPIGVVSVMRGT
jgi:hypothetical protein